MIRTMCTLMAMLTLGAPSVVGQEQGAQETAALTAYKVAPSYFIPNTAHQKTGKRLVDQDGVVAFVQTQQGRVMFTPSGAYIGISVPTTDVQALGTEGHKRERLQGLEEVVETRTVVLKAGLLPIHAAKRGITPRLEEASGATVNFFVGPESDWRSGIPTYQKLVYEDAWQGVDLEYVGHMDRLEFRLLVHPDQDPAQIQLESGADTLELLADGSLVACLEGAELSMSAPFAYQEHAGIKIPVDVQYCFLSEGQIGFQLGRYDESQLLIIDPYLSWSTFLGGTNTDFGQGIAVDSGDNAYITGFTDSSTFPTTVGAYDESHNGNYDVFVSKLNSDGTALVYSTFLGGTSYDQGNGIAVDSSGNAYVTGLTSSPTFPTTVGAYAESHNGNGDVFVRNLNSDGTAIVYSTFLGDTSYDDGYGIAVDSSGNTYVTGYTDSATFPTTVSAYDESHNSGYDVYVSKLNSDGTALVYSTFLGGTSNDYGQGIAVDGSGNAYVSGYTASPTFPTTVGTYDESHNGDTVLFVSKLNSDGTTLVYSTFLGGTGSDEGRAIAVDSSGNAYVTGRSISATFPTTVGAYDESHNGSIDVFVSKLNGDGTALVYSTFLGGTSSDYGTGIAVDSSGNVYITGYTSSPTFPTTAGAYDESHDSLYDVFVSKLNSDGTALVYSTFLGGTGWDYGTGIALDSSGNAYVTGYTQSATFPTTVGAYDESHNGLYDVFVTKIDFCSPDQPGNIMGIAAVCAGDTGQGYAIAAVSGATGYTWTVPTGASITSGQGTTAIEVTFGSTSGDITVTANNACGSSSAQSLSVVFGTEILDTQILPPGNAQGNNPLMFATAIVDCGGGSFDFEWELLETGDMFFGDPIMLPMLIETSTLELRAFSTKRGVLSHQATILVHDALNLDVNGDGCNTLEDLWFLIPFWTQAYQDDPNGDGQIHVLDLLYLNLDEPAPCL